jgi:4-amino-4-deoxy-L-arabinose transferase-like glycosyltransferase
MELSLQRRRFLLFAGWLLIAWVTLFWRLGEPTFWDPDEAHYAVTTRELLRSGDWLAPTYNGRPFFDKPVFFHELQAMTMSVVGVNELGARLVEAIAALGLIGMTYWLALVVCGRKTASIAALLLTICPAVLGLTRYAILDMVFTLFLFGGVSLLTMATLAGRRRLEWAGYVALALAVLTKGPVGLVLVALTFLAILAVSPRGRRALLGLHWIVGGAIVVALASPWFAYMYWRFAEEFVRGYVLNENLLLFSRPPYGNQPGWTFYLQIVAVGMLPWTPALVGRLWDLGSDIVARRPIELIDTFLWCWIGTIVVFFSVSQFKLDHYVFPAAPALCLVIARSWVDATSPDRQRHGGARLGFRFVGPILAIGGVALGVAMVRLLLPPLVWVVPAVWVVAGIALTARGQSGIIGAPWTVATAFTVLYAVVISAVAPVLERQKVVADVARWVAAQAGPDTKVCSYRLNRWNNSLLFYVDRPVTMTDTPDDMRAFLAASKSLFCVMPVFAHDELRAAGIELLTVHQRDGAWATSGRSLRRTGVTPTTFLVVTKP